MSKRHSIHELLAALLLVVPGLAPATTLGHGFSYQGQLSRSGVPVQGNVALRFSLWDAAGSGDPPTGGNQVGTVQTLTSVPVSGGIFSVVLNAGNEFGSQAFNGEARWLQVEVCADTTCSAVTVLGPRQAITGAPYALGPWQMNGTNLGYLGGNVGIGTATPGRPSTSGPTSPRWSWRTARLRCSSRDSSHSRTRRPRPDGWVTAPRAART